MFRPGFVPTAFVGGALVVGLWLGGGSLVRGHDAAAQVPTPQAAMTAAAPMVAPQPALPQVPVPPAEVAPVPPTSSSHAPIATLTDVPGVVASVYKVEGQIIVVANTGIAITADLSPSASSGSAAPR